MLNVAVVSAGSSRAGGQHRVEAPRSSAAGPAASGASPDEELIARVSRRDEAALGMVYDRYHRLVFTIALRVVGDRDLAEEVVQDVFQAVWQSAGSFQPRASVSAWLIGITRHRAIDATRSRRFRARAREDLLDERVAGSGGADADQLTLRAVMRTALAELPASQRQAIELGYYGGLSQSEIAAQLGEPVGTIKSRVRMGLLKLRDLLAEAQ